MFRSSGGTGIGLPLSVQQQYLYDKSYDEERTSFGLPEGLLLHEMPQLSPCLTANPNNPSPEIIPLASLSFHHTHRKKPMKKDRHSKIITAQGARDRRMRLSLDIAKRFFYLQDQLGFDKASKTIEWLLNQSRVAINELARSKASGSPENNLSSSEKGGSAGSYNSPTSDGEIASGIDETYPEEKRKDNSKEKTPAIFKEKKMSLYRKNIFDPQSRAKARLRARQRTWMKKNFDDTKNLSSASPLETAEDVSSHSMDHQGSYLDIIEESFSSIYSFDYNENVPISRRMNVENLVSKDNSTIKFFMANVNPHFHLSAETAQDRLVSLPLSPTSSAAFTDLPLCSKPWEIFGNQSLY